MFDHIIGRCLNKKPEERYENAGRLRDDLVKLRPATASGVSTSGVAWETPRSKGRRRALQVGGALLVVLAVAMQRSRCGTGAAARVDWARTEAIPRIQELAAETGWLERGTRAWEGHELALEAEHYLGDDPSLQQAWAAVASEISITSEPPGAEVRAKAYTDVEGEWRVVGRTPLEKIRFPAGASRVTVDLVGHDPAYDLVFNIAYKQFDWHFDLQARGIGSRGDGLHLRRGGAAAAPGPRPPRRRDDGRLPDRPL